MERPAPNTPPETPKPRTPAEPTGRSTFRDFYERHAATVLHFLRFQVRDEDRPDVASLAFEIAARDLERFTAPDGVEPEAAERNWILTITRNVAGNWRKQHRQPERIDSDDVRAPTNLESETAAFELAHALLWTLPEHVRTIYLWNHRDGETHEEIAERLGIPVGTVKSQLRAAQEELDATIDRLCARERMKRADYLRGAIPLPFLGAEGLARVLRSVEEEIDPDAAEYIWNGRGRAASPFAPPPAAHALHGATVAAVGSAAPKVAVAFTGAKVAAVAVASALAGAALLALLRPAPAVPVTIAPADVAPTLATAAALPATTAAPEAPSTARTRAVAPSALASGAASTDAYPTEDLAMQATRNAFAAGDAKRALQLASKQYPGGMFAAERESIAIRALAQLGRMSEAKQRAATFRRTFPKSVFRSVVDAAVGEGSP